MFIHKWNEPYLSLLPSRRSSPHFGRYSFSVPWVTGHKPRWFTRPQTVTHPSTNRARRRVTSLIEIIALPLSQAATGPVGDFFGLMVLLPSTLLVGWRKRRTAWKKPVPFVPKVLFQRVWRSDSYRTVSNSGKETFFIHGTFLFLGRFYFKNVGKNGIRIL